MVEQNMNFLVARADKHYWEEPVISGARGSGTIFFGGCNLRCVFCQNYRISSGINSLTISDNQLVYLMQYLEDSGVHNINLVTPSHYARKLSSVLERAKALIRIPFVYNSSGYDRVEDLRRLDGLVDVYLPDLKYVDKGFSLRYSSRSDYFEIASSAILEMRRQQPHDIISDGIMTQGVVVRHLLLPSLSEDSKRVLDYLASVDRRLYISLMSQYFPCGDLAGFGEINRRINRQEYDAVLQHFFKLGLKNGFTQELDSAIEDYVPDFDLERLKEQITWAEQKYSQSQ